jgi:hypothetical protein
MAAPRLAHPRASIIRLRQIFEIAVVLVVIM